VQNRRPNIIMIQSDSMDGRAFGAMGLKALERATPNLDALAKDGTLFEYCYTTNPICVCSRASMWSGQYTFRCHGWNNYKGLPANTTTFLTELTREGYTPGVFGKTDYVSGNHSMRARVTAWTRSAMIERPAYQQAAPTIFETQEKKVHKGDWKKIDQGLEFLEAHRSDDAPFFLYIGLNAPHPKFYTSRYYLDKVDMDAIAIPPQDENEHPVMAYMRRTKNWTHGLDDASVRQTRAIYYAMIAEVDEMVGTLLDAAQGLDNTYVLYLSDHGEMNMEHGQYYKMNAFEPSARVPLIVKGPNIPAGRRVSHLASLIDIYPTLLDMAGAAPQKKTLHGQSMLPVLHGKEDTRENIAFLEYEDSTACTGIFMLRQDQYKYIAYPRFAPQLFDLENDPWEIHNLAEQMPEKCAQMDARLRKIVDYEAFNALVEENDKDCFRVWRDEQKTAGTYEANMAEIFSCGEDVKPEQIVPWSEADEQQIVSWLESGIE